MGRLLDRPMDLCVGMVEPDGTERTLPFTSIGKPLVNCEQFERFNSITYRGYSGKHNIRFELNIHSPFYPQDEKLCLLPVVYLEFRVHHVIHARWRQRRRVVAARARDHDREGRGRGGAAGRRRAGPRLPKRRGPGSGSGARANHE